MSETVANVEAEATEPALPDIHLELGKIRGAHAEAVVAVEEAPERDMFWVELKPSALVPVVKLLRDDRALSYNFLDDLTCVDRPWEERRFCVIYNLYSHSRLRRLILRVRVPEGEPVPTLTGLFAAADWAEREVYDLFGVTFKGHPNMTRIQLPDDWEGHPLRKDYPIVGRRPVLLYNDVKDVL
jgi:NADH-quinone oxidoreductase subunit C